MQVRDILEEVEIEIIKNSLMKVRAPCLPHRHPSATGRLALVGVR